MRVLLSFPTRIGTPGIGTTAWYQATSLARLGAEVHGGLAVLSALFPA